MESYLEGQSDPTKWKVKERWTWGNPQDWYGAEAEEQSDDFDLLSFALPLALAFIPGMQGLATTIGQGLGMSAGLGATALGTGVISGGLNLLQTGNLKSALKTGVFSGAGSYAGGSIGAAGNAGGALAGWDPSIVRGLAGATRGLISSGGNPIGALSGGLAPFMPQGYSGLAPIAANVLTGRKNNPYQLLQGMVNTIGQNTTKS
jgi:hypothetical protein